MSRRRLVIRRWVDRGGWHGCGWLRLTRCAWRGTAAREPAFLLDAQDYSRSKAASARGVTRPAVGVLSARRTARRRIYSNESGRAYPCLRIPAARPQSWSTPCGSPLCKLRTIENASDRPHCDPRLHSAKWRHIELGSQQDEPDLDLPTLQARSQVDRAGANGFGSSKWSILSKQSRYPAHDSLP